jgi:methylglyoxal synthase
MIQPASQRRIGLVASASLRAGANGTLARFLLDFAPLLAGQLQARLFMPGLTYDAVVSNGVLSGYPGLERLPPAREGGLITLTALVVGETEADRGLDWVIYLLDPTDPAALYPETQALKRQCVVHDKPFLSTVTAASEWCTLEWHRLVAGGGPAVPALPGLIDRFVRPAELGQETLALIAHDRLKPELLAFAQRHRRLLSLFGRRLATGTTGSLLNGRLPQRLLDRPGEFVLPTTPAGEDWVHAVKSGPRGGDAQIAQEVMVGRCRRAIFFEDPHVAREHEADIQLLERATRFAPTGCLCLNSRATADQWAVDMERVLGCGSPG